MFAQFVAACWEILGILTFSISFSDIFKGILTNGAWFILFFYFTGVCHRFANSA